MRIAVRASWCRRLLGLVFLGSALPLAVNLRPARADLLYFKDGFWMIRDLNSTNGLKVNGEKLPPGGKKILAPTDTITIAKRDFKIEYEPADRLSRIEELMEEEEEDIMGVPLLEKAGLEHPSDPRDRPKKHQPPKFNWDDEDDDDDD